MNFDMNVALELFGYVGTVMVVVSMLMTSITKLRIINMCGSVISTIYSIIVGAWPIVVMNTCIFAINMYHVISALKNKSELICVRVGASDGSLQHFISLYEDGIKEKFPEYSFNIDENSDIYIIYRQNLAISFFAGKREAESYNLNIGYSLPGYESVAQKCMLAHIKKCGATRIFENGVPVLE